MYDTFILGQISLDINVNHDGTAIHESGGAVIYSGFAAGSLGHKTAVLPKGNPADVDPAAAFAQAQNVDVFPVASAHSTSIKNVYHTPDKERRTSTAISRIEPYRPSDIPPDVKTRIYHIAGLMRGDLGEDIIAWCSGKALVALDVQGVLRCVEDGAMVFHDWTDKKTWLPKIDFLKTDALEAEIMTGTADRAEATRLLHSWGAKEIMITHNTEALIYDGQKIYTRALKPRNLSGRSGRGDTCFSTYITERLSRPPEEALLLAAATVSLKMEKPGPFNLSRGAVEAYIREFY
ncbi:MAG: PfkB family carbohydrate kinase [Treponema sp.]|jgi:sugar/nucleoside kinase (ribokinase family)|nr:PfkB family carbohydrate kinase [Treponema sp.]